MPIKFKPNYSITPQIAQDLMKIEALKTTVINLPISVSVIKRLRETARLYTTHYSTMIEGNQLEIEQIKAVLEHDEHFPGREREEHEIRGYYAGLSYVERCVDEKIGLSERFIQYIHALVLSSGKKKVQPTPYRDGQNVIRDGFTRRIVYLPPEATDVPLLMKALVQWVRTSDIPVPIIAAIAHYQFATIHPYYDGNGRTARLLTTFILYQHGYDLKRLFSLEEYYARDLGAYYQAISIGPSHNYYMGREEADITPWVEYFVHGMAVACEKVVQRMKEAQESGEFDQSELMRTLDARQRKVLILFNEFDVVTAQQVGKLFGFKPRTSSKLCKDWVDAGFFEIADAAKKNRTYTLSPHYKKLIFTNNK